eukprot:TRINITY_DN3351_c0_g1_i1.p1 TRINITY_DN3351_c0_g1~~TRINITY_DN3351_c0_g1_i1.p1  ORF type:complete len:298 (+),score=93.59 TRINITY_DN3351_c0_g1_i1:137-1030(+)
MIFTALSNLFEPQMKNPFFSSTPEEHNTKLAARFCPVKVIGKGSFGEVFMARDSKNNSQVALKKIKCTNASEIQLAFNEIEAGKHLKHPNLIKVKEAYKSKNHVHLAMEYVEGEDLFSLMSNRKFKAMEESEGAQMMLKLSKAIRYMHRKKFAHLDIKLENILIAKSEEPVLIDFGLSSKSKKDSDLSKRWSGSPDYACPQIVLHQEYLQNKADVWSLGVVFFVLMTGELPFDREERFNALRKGQHPVVFENDIVYKVNDQFKSLLRGMLEINQEKRLSMDEVVKHPFFKPYNHKKK